MPKLDQVIHTIGLSEGSSVSLDDNNVTITNDAKAISREFRHPKVSVRISSSSVEVVCELPRRKDKAIAGTWAAHIRNMVKGVEEGFVKILSLKSESERKSERGDRGMVLVC